MTSIEFIPEVVLIALVIISIALGIIKSLSCMMQEDTPYRKVKLSSLAESRYGRIGRKNFNHKSDRPIYPKSTSFIPSDRRGD